MKIADDTFLGNSECEWVNKLLGILPVFTWPFIMAGICHGLGVRIPCLQVSGPEFEYLMNIN